MNQAIYDTIEKVLTLLDCKLNTISAKKSEVPDSISYDISSPDAKVLIGRDGETLQALWTIIRQLLEKQGIETKGYHIDINGYYEAKIKKIKHEAMMMAERATMFGREVEMRPLTSYERMIVHHVLQDRSDVVTESTGEGKFRKLIIKLKK